MSRHVDDPDRAGSIDDQWRESEVDGDAAALLLWQAIGINAGKDFYQRSLAVVDVAGGAEDHGPATGTRVTGSGHAPGALLPDPVGPELAVSGNMLLKEFAQESLMRTGVD